MAEPVVLPKFEIQGDKPHWAVRAAWVTGGLFLFSVIGLGAVIAHHRNLETQAIIARAEAVARVKAEADAKIAAIAAAAKAQKDAELAARSAARLSAQSMPTTTVPSAGEEADPTSGVPGAIRTHHSRRLHYSHGGGKVNGGHTMSTPKTGGKAAANKPDAIDELLRKMK